MKRAAFVAAALLVVACGKGSGSGGGGECQQAVDHAMSVSDPTKGMDAKQAAALKPMMTAMAKTAVERCNGDHWKSDVTSCMKKAVASDDLNKCQESLTPEQHKAFDAALQKTAAANTPVMPPEPPPEHTDGSAMAPAAGSSMTPEAGSSAGSAGSAGSGATPTP